MANKSRVRAEQEVFDDLAKLCVSPGYAHAIAYFCFRDHVVGYGEELKGEDYARLFSFDRLIRTEISTLIGLMFRGPRDLTIPKPMELQHYIERTEALLKEMHEAMQQPFFEKFRAALADRSKATAPDPFSNAEAMREPIFYGAESAYSFQYRDLAVERYAKDRDWLTKNKGFSTDEGQKVIRAIGDFLSEKLLAILVGLKGLPPEKWSILDGFRFSVADIVTKSGLAEAIVRAVLSAFAFPDDNNPTFVSLHAFNSANAFPIFKGDEDDYFLFLYVSLTETLYDSPFYWMVADKAYKESAMMHRGEFTESFSAGRLVRVFGRDNVFCNVDIWDKAKKNKLGEIDVLVLIADRAIVAQAKSKKLTLEARKGNDLQLQSDFKAAIQDAYDQSLACSQHLVAGKAIFSDAAGKEISVPAIKEAFPICVVSDHYPALSFQARQFLKATTTDIIRPALVCDVFLLDVLTELLDTPLRCLSYLELRARAGDNVMLSHEITALGYHLRKNLWLGEADLLVLEDDISTDVDIAMAARRDGIAGEKTPVGILTHLRGTSVGRIIEQIEKRSDAGAVGIGLELLKLSGKAAKDLSAAIDKLATAAKDRKQHDITIGTTGESGLTVHFNELADAVAATRLQQHCEVRKYSQKAPKWFGLALQPDNGALRFGLMLEYPWRQDDAMDEAVAKMPKGESSDVLSVIAKSSDKLDKRSVARARQQLERQALIRQTREFRELQKRKK